MRAGVPINKINCFREVFQENRLRLTDSQNLHQLVPFLEQQEFDSLKGQIKDPLFFMAQVMFVRH